jgi:hypothetical protein
MFLNRMRFFNTRIQFGTAIQDAFRIAAMTKNDRCTIQSIIEEKPKNICEMRKILYTLDPGNSLNMLSGISEGAKDCRKISNMPNVEVKYIFYMLKSSPSLQAKFKELTEKEASNIAEYKR